jgi:hypothetical protein
MELILKAGHTLAAALLLLLAGPLVAFLAGLAPLDRDWRTASHAPMGIAPNPKTAREPIIQVYAARAFAWRGAFAVHTWIAAKRADAPRFTTYEVIGWNVMHGREALISRAGPPDRRWYDAEPEVITELRGAEVEALIDRLEAAISQYPYKDTYRTWPGPNSNTFTAWIARRLPELRLDLPPTAIGKDFLGDSLVAASPSGTGWQVSLFGLTGLLLSREEGIEINILGLTLGLDPLDLAIKLPGLGRFTAMPQPGNAATPPASPPTSP